GKPRVFMSGQYNLTPISRLPGLGFLGRTQIYTQTRETLLPLGAMQRSGLWRMRKSWRLTLLRPCLPWVIIKTTCCVITGLPKPRFDVSAEYYPAAARCHMP